MHRGDVSPSSSRNSSGRQVSDAQAAPFVNGSDAEPSPHCVAIAVKGHKRLRSEPFTYALESLLRPNASKLVLICCLSKVRDEMGVDHRVDGVSFSGINGKKLNDWVQKQFDVLSLALQPVKNKLKNSGVQNLPSSRMNINCFYFYARCWTRFRYDISSRLRLDPHRGLVCNYFLRCIHEQVEFCMRIVTGPISSTSLVHAANAIRPNWIVLDKSFQDCEALLGKELQCGVVITYGGGKVRELKPMQFQGFYFSRHFDDHFSDELSVPRSSSTSIASIGSGSAESNSGSNRNPFMLYSSASSRSVTSFSSEEYANDDGSRIPGSSVHFVPEGELNTSTRLTSNTEAVPSKSSVYTVPTATISVLYGLKFQQGHDSKPRAVRIATLRTETSSISPSTSDTRTGFRWLRSFSIYRNRSRNSAEMGNVAMDTELPPAPREEDGGEYWKVVL